MENTEILAALSKLHECTRTRNDDVVENVLLDLETLTLEMDHWPKEFFEGLDELARDQSFLSLGKSWKLFYFINCNWEQLPESKRESFRQTLADAFDNCGDWMGAFVIGEMLGEHYADEKTLETFAELSKAPHLHWRELLPHALETLAKTTTQSPLRNLAILQLQELKKHDSEYVRQEAVLSLAKLEPKA